MSHLINAIHLENMHPELALSLFNYFDSASKLNIIRAYRRFGTIISHSSEALKKFELNIDSKNIDDLLTDSGLKEIPFRKITSSFDSLIVIDKIKAFLQSRKDTIETLKLKNFNARSFTDFCEVLNSLVNLKFLQLENCCIENPKHAILPPILSLKSISFNKCHDSVFNFFKDQPTLEKLIVINPDASWIGFNHAAFTEILNNAKGCQEVVLEGAGTGSYFDNEEFPFKIKKLSTTMISYGWYVGLKSNRVDFLNSQKECLAELTIGQLPNDFDGGEILKFIIFNNNLNKFYYEKIPLILNGQKQEVYEFVVTEIQITSMFEMVRQFPTIKKVKVILNKTEVCSDEIERRVDPVTTLFENIEELEVDDRSAPFGIFGVFLGAYKNFRNIRRLKLKTQDSNINTIFEECLKVMKKLEEIHITSTTSRVTERLNAIDKFTPNIKKLKVSPQFVDIARNHFERRVEVEGI